MNSSQTNIPTTSNQQCNNTYARITSTPPVTTFPKRNQAIVINVIENLRLPDYIKAIGSIVQPRNILFASRISNNRVCIYLSSVDLVDRLVEHHSSIKIEDYELNIRRLITPARRLILSNVSPNIPHIILERALTELKVQMQTPISFLKATYISDDYNHIMSFRRQLYIHPDDNLQLPPSITVDYEDTSYRIFLGYDDVVCFLCKEKGHITKQCPKQHQQTTNTEKALSSVEHDTPSTTPNESSFSQSSTELRQTVPTAMDAEMSQIFADIVNSSKKRSATTIDNGSVGDLVLTQVESETATEDSPNKTPLFATPKQISQPPKKPKISDPPSPSAPTTMEMLEPARSHFKETNTITFKLLTDFLDNARGTTDLFGLASTYTNNISDLVECLRGIYPHLTHRSIKSRCTRAINKLTKQTNTQNSEYPDTDTSTSSF